MKKSATLENPPSARPPDSRLLMRDRAYTALKKMIQSGKIPANSMISERELSDRLAMSKTPIRAALSVLELHGLVSVVPQKGIYLRELTAREIVEIFDLRMAVEPYVVRRLAQRTLSADERRELKAKLAAHRKGASQRALELSTELDIEFHKLLATILGNREIDNVLNRCFDRLYRSILLINQASPIRLAESHGDHEGIVAQILKGDAQKSAEAMERHLAFGRQFILNGGTVS